MNSRLSSSWVQEHLVSRLQQKFTDLALQLARARAVCPRLLAVIMEVCSCMGAAASHAAAADPDQQLQQSLIVSATAGARGTPLLDTHETLHQIKTVVHAESSAQKLFSLRISQTQDFNRNLASIESAKRAEIDMFVEGNLESECTKQELWQVPPGQQLLEESWGRLKSLHALKSNQKNAIVAGDNVQSSSSTIRAHNQNVEILLIRIASAEHHELQIIEDIVYEKICAEDQQKRLKELDEMHHNCVLALREEQHNVLVERLKNMREERDNLLDEWVDARKQLLEHVEEIKNNTRNTTTLMMEEEEKHRKERQEEQQHLANMTAMVRSFQEVNNQPGNKKATTTTDTTLTTSSSQQGSGACDCSVCFEEMDSGNNNNNTTAGSSRGSLPHVDSSSSAKKRACFRPCNHAAVCLDCAVQIWSNTKTCPMCKAKLTTKPEAIYL